MKKALIAGAMLGALASTAHAEKVFKYAFQGDLQGVDPQALYETFQLATMSNVYESLVDRDEKLGLRPSLATSWKLVAPTKWEFKLRKGVKFHNGNDFTAEDVVFSWKRGFLTDMGATSKKVKNIEIVDDHTVILETPDKNPLLPADWTHFLIMDKTWTEKHGAATPKAEEMGTLYTASNANGTGPFKVESYKAGVKTVFTRNTKHWNKKARTNLDKVVFTPIGQDATRVAALLSGAVDLAYPIPLQDQKRVQDNNKVDLLAGPETRSIFVGFDQWRDELKGSDVKGKNPFKDIRVRQAFVHAVNLELIKKKVMRGASVPSGTMIAEAINGFDKSFAEPYKYDLKKAKNLMAEAGYPNGFKVTMDCPNNRYVNDEKICQAVVSMLGKIKVKVDLLAQPKAQYFSKILAPNGYDTSFYLLGWAPSSLDGLNTLDALLSCRNKETGKGQYNLGNYCNPKITELGAKIQVELDEKKRNALIKEAYTIVRKDYGYMPIHDQALSWGASKKVDVVQRANNALMFVDIVAK